MALTLGVLCSGADSRAQDQIDKRPVSCDLHIAPVARQIVQRIEAGPVAGMDGLLSGRLRVQLGDQCSLLAQVYNSGRGGSDGGTYVCDQGIGFDQPVQAYGNLYIYLYYVKQLTSENIRQGTCSKIAACIASAGPNDDIQWLQDKVTALGCWSLR